MAKSFAEIHCQCNLITFCFALSRTAVRQKQQKMASKKASRKNARDEKDRLPACSNQTKILASMKLKDDAALCVQLNISTRS